MGIKSRTKEKLTHLLRKSFFICLLLTQFQLQGNPLLAQYRCSLKGSKQTLSDAFREIRKQTGLTIFYDHQLLNDRELVNANFNNAPLEEVLDFLLEGKKISYSIKRDKVIVLQRAAAKVENLPLTLQETVQGTILDENGEPIPGVSVRVKDVTGRGTSSDANGKFSLLVDLPATLIFSYTGYARQELPITNSAPLSITLSPEEAALDEVVVVGYGQVRKGDLTGSVSSVKSEEITALPSINAMQSLTGRSAGVQVNQASGAPGAGMSVRVRGSNSLLGSNDPLYVIDGFAISGAPTILDPNDIESMEVLKDASATAIYGARGANGVVMITTKSGKKDQNQVSLNSFIGFQDVTKKIDMLNARQFAEIANERARNDGVNPYFTADEVAGFGEGTNWQDAIFRTAPIQNHSLNFSGGNERTRYSVSGNYFDQDGIIINSGYQRGSIRANLEQKVSDKLTLNLTSLMSRTITNNITNDNQSRGSGVVSAALVAPPTVPVYDANGNYSNVVPYSFSSNAAENPVALAMERLNRAAGSGVLTNFGINYAFTENLTLRVSAGIDYANSRTDYYSSSKIRSTPAGNAQTSYYTRTNFLNENVLNYRKSLGSDLLDLTAGITYQSDVVHNNSQSASGFATDVLQNRNLQSATVIGTPQSSLIEWRLLSGFFRANYNLKEKYLFTASIRADGSSRFGATSQWGYFPSAAFAWRVHDEEFLSDFAALSNLKLRASWGESGNTAISPYGSLNVLGSSNIILGDNLYSGFAPQNQRPNPNLRWETTAQTNIGLDVGLWQERLRLTADYYIKNTRDLLASVPLPTSTGFNSQFLNIGEIRNQGVEFDLGASILNREFQWDANVNFSANRNKVISLANHADVFGAALAIPLSISPNLVREGQPIGVFFGFVEEGLNDEGRIRYRDLDGNGVINNNDRAIIGDPNPDFIFGFDNNFRYKNFHLNIFFQGVQGFDLFNFNLANHENAFNFGENQTQRSLDRWTTDNPDPNAPNPVVSVGSSFRQSDRFVEDGSFIRLKNIRLGYNFNVSNWGILRSLQVYGSAQNLWTITNYSWYDPEVSTRGNEGANSGITLGIDQTAYPVARTLTFGLQATF